MIKKAIFLVSLFLSHSINAYADSDELRLKMDKASSSAVNKKAPPAKKGKLEKLEPVEQDSEIPVALKLENELIIKSKDAYPREYLDKIYNDKEVLVSSFDAGEARRIRNKFANEHEKNLIKKVFLDNLYVFLNNKDQHCEMNYIKLLLNDLSHATQATAEDDFLDFFKMLRSAGTIDDIFYEILQGLTRDHFALQQVDLLKKATKNPLKNYKKIVGSVDLNAFFSSFKNYPNEVDACSITEFLRLQRSAGKEKDSRSAKNDKIQDLLYPALSQGVIPLSTFNKLKFLATDSTLNERYIWLNDYFRIVFLAKNRMIPFSRNYKVVHLDDENGFSSERIKRFSRITRRKVLYRKYDENQIIMLAQVMKKASQRMGVDPDTKTGVPYLIQEFKVQGENGEENYVEKIELDTQSQFNLARRLLRKDIVALQMMNSFQNVKITYDDLVMASLETGYISLDDIEYVVKYDDLWNPEVSKSERMLSLTFKIAGFSTFFLPPPWNVTGALALSVIEGIVDSNNVNGADNDNPNTFIE